MDAVKPHYRIKCYGVETALVELGERPGEERIVKAVKSSHPLAVKLLADYGNETGQIARNLSWRDGHWVASL